MPVKYALGSNQYKKKRLSKKQIAKIKKQTRIWIYLIIAQTAFAGILFHVGYEWAQLPQEPVHWIEFTHAQAEPTMRDWVLQTVEDAGINPQEADRIVNCESRWNDQAHAVNWGNKAGVDRGIWMINSLYHPEVSNAEAYDYKQATNHAIRIYKEAGSWQPWSCKKVLSK